MKDARGPRRRTVKARVLLAAAAGATTLSFQTCSPPLYSANLMALSIPCEADGGPLGCDLPYVPPATDAGFDGGSDAGTQKNDDGGTTGGDH